MIGEALMLGLASGPACVASCGPVLVPSLLAEHEGFRLNGRYLGTFLSTRLLGYLLFATVAWAAGSVLSPGPTLRDLIGGVVYVLLAAVLLWYAKVAGRASCSSACAAGPQRSQLVTIGAPGKRGVPGAALFGLLTGFSLCPPFVAAGVRAAQLGSLALALLFFALFFVGTSVWFVPFIGLGRVQRNEGVVTVARMAMVLIAFYYGYMGVMFLLGRRIHG
jgi:hypothetical protein